MQSGLAAVSVLGVELVGSAAWGVVSRQGIGGCGSGRGGEGELMGRPQPLYCYGGIIGAVTGGTCFSASHRSCNGKDFACGSRQFTKSHRINQLSQALVNGVS